MRRLQQIQFKKALEARRDELMRQIAEGREGLAIGIVGDQMDNVCGIAEREFAIRNADRVSELLRQVEGALREIREGTFGVCEQCGDPIPPKRLQAVPWSPYCITCQERAERSERSRAYALAG